MALAQVPTVPAPTPLYDIVSNAPFSAVSSVPVSWTAGKYRRVEYQLRVTSSSGGSAVLTLTGLGGTYSGWNTYNFGVTSSPNPWSSNADAANWDLQNATNLGQTDGCIWVASGGLRTHQSRTLDATSGYDLMSQGKNTDTASDVSGLVLTFPGATSGWLEVLGYA